MNRVPRKAQVKRAAGSKAKQWRTNSLHCPGSPKTSGVHARHAWTRDGRVDGVMITSENKIDSRSLKGDMKKRTYHMKEVQKGLWVEVMLANNLAKLSNVIQASK